jgi:hypothetical protein
VSLNDADLPADQVIDRAWAQRKWRALSISWSAAGRREFRERNATLAS